MKVPADQPQGDPQNAAVQAKHMPHRPAIDHQTSELADDQTLAQNNSNC